MRTARVFGADVSTPHNIGSCIAPFDAQFVTNCLHCGRQLNQRAGGFWVTWDVVRQHNAVPQTVESEAQYRRRVDSQARTLQAFHRRLGHLGVI